MTCLTNILTTLLALIAIAASAEAPKWHELNGYTFDKYCLDFGRQYQGEEYDMRKGVFANKLKEIHAHNSDKRHTWKQGVNQFSDWTVSEKKNYNTFKAHRTAELSEKMTTRVSGQSHLPAEVDYRTWTSPAVLTGVKNQGHCGGCWGFSAVETIESQFALATGQLAVLSPQQVLSCTKKMLGCGGGDYFIGWMYLMQTTGLNEEWLYPYTDFFAKNESRKATAKCDNITKKFLPNFAWWPKVGIPESMSSLVQVPQNNASALMEALAVVGPQSIAVAAEPWFSYAGGIFQNSPSKGEWAVDHAVQAVGYGHDISLGMNYWIVRNSWGTSWGEDGYIRLSRPTTEPCNDKKTICGTSGILSEPGYPLVMKLKKINR